MVELQSLLRTAFNTTPLVTLPYKKTNGIRNRFSREVLKLFHVFEGFYFSLHFLIMLFSACFTNATPLPVMKN